MQNNSGDWLIEVLEPVRELLRDIEYATPPPSLSERVLEARLRLDRSIERLKHGD